MNRLIVYGVVFACFFSLSCEKETGNFFLRINPPSDTLISNLEVFDSFGPVLTDGEFHQVHEWLEISYVINDVLDYKIEDWDSTMILDEYYYQDVPIHEYLGEFEKGESDKYYSLEIKYISDFSDEPAYNQWLGYYFYYYYYYNYSELTYKSTSE